LPLAPRVSSHLVDLLLSAVFFVFSIRRPPRPTPFPYTTLFRSRRARRRAPRRCGDGGSAAVSASPGPGACARSRHWRYGGGGPRSEEHTSELQSRFDLVCRLLLEKKKDQQVVV